MGDRSQHRVSLKASVFFIGGVISQRLFVHAGSEKKKVPGNDQHLAKGWRTFFSKFSRV